MSINKILITTENYYPNEGGIEQFVWGLNNFLQEREKIVTVLTGSVEGLEVEEVTQYGHIIRTPYLVGAITNPQKVMKNWQKLVPIIQKIDPDIVHANNHSSLAVIKACNFLKIPVTYTCHGWGMFCPMGIRLVKPGENEELCMNERNLHNCFNCLLKRNTKANQIESEFMAPTILRTGRKLFDLVSPVPFRGLNSRYVIYRKVRQFDYFQDTLENADKVISLSKMYSRFFTPKKVATIPLGIDTRQFQKKIDTKILAKFGIAGDYILVTSRIHHNKGQVDAVKALNYLPKKIKLVLAGNSSLLNGDKYESNVHLKEIKDLIDEHQLRSRVIFTGFVGKEDLNALYSSATATIVPSIWAEPYGYVTLEAMSCECPVVVTNNSGSSEIVIDSVNGYKVPRRTPKKIAAAVEKIIYNRKLMGKHARDSVKLSASWESIGPRILSLLEDVYEQK